MQRWLISRRFKTCVSFCLLATLLVVAPARHGVGENLLGDDPWLQKVLEAALKNGQFYPEYEKHLLGASDDAARLNAAKYGNGQFLAKYSKSGPRMRMPSSELVNLFEAVIKSKGTIWKKQGGALHGYCNVGECIGYGVLGSGPRSQTVIETNCLRVELSGNLEGGAVIHGHPKPPDDPVFVKLSPSARQALKGKTLSVVDPTLLPFMLVGAIVYDHAVGPAFDVWRTNYNTQLGEFSLTESLKANRANAGISAAGGFFGEVASQHGYGKTALYVGLGADGIGGFSSGFNAAVAGKKSGFMGGLKGGVANLGATGIQIGTQLGVAYLGGNETQAEGAGRLAGLATASLGGPHSAVTYGVSTVASDVGSIAASYASATKNGMSTRTFIGETASNYLHYLGQYFN